MTNVRRLTLLPCAALALALAAGIGGPAQAERLVFSNLRTLEIEEFSIDGEELVAVLPGGSEIRVELDAVREIRPSLPPLPSDAGPERVSGGTWRKAGGGAARHVRRAARRWRIAPELIVAVAHTESRLNPTAVSPKGALGVMQLMPSTARLMAVRDPFDPRQNIDGGARWLRMMLDRFKGDVDLALAAYNAGPETVKRYGGIPPYAETRRYVRQVREKMGRMQPGAASGA
jgi:soluble lytic murein transglycosylase-like protein